MSKKKGGLFQKIKKLFHQLNRISLAEKEKKERKKSAKKSSVKPKGFLARKIGVITFWSILGFVFLVVLVTIFSSNSGEANTEKVEIKYNYATSPEGIQFAENFAKDYFTWQVSDEGKHKRKETMSKYLAEGLDQYAGLKFDGLEWNSTFKDSEIKEVKEITDNVSQITLLVRADLKKKDSDDVKRIEKYLVVPVAYDGKTFGVYDLPKFTYIQEDTTLKRVISNKLNQAEAIVSDEIKDFLPTFFRSYADDTKDKLNYLLTNDSVTDGLQGTMKFEKIQDVNVFEGEEPNSYVVFTKVIFIEPQTNVTMETSYQLTVVNRDERFIVSGIDNQSNIEIQSKIETKGVSSENEETTQDEVLENTNEEKENK